MSRLTQKIPLVEEGCQKDRVALNTWSFGFDLGDEWKPIIGSVPCRKRETCVKLPLCAGDPHSVFTLASSPKVDFVVTLVFRA